MSNAGDKFQVIDETHEYLEFGEIITLVEDDGTSCKFYHDVYGNLVCIGDKRVERVEI